MSSSSWMSPHEIVAFAFGANDRAQLRRRMLDDLMQRTHCELGLCSEINRKLTTDDIVCHQSLSARVATRTLRWLNAARPGWGQRRHIPRVVLGFSFATRAKATRSVRDRGSSPANVEMHHLVSLWRTRADVPVALVIGRIGSPHPKELVSAAVSTVCTLALADSSLPEPEPEVHLELTARQRQILELVSNGLTNAEVARLCGVSKFTVRNHLSKMFEQFGATNRTELTQLFLKDDGHVSSEW